MNLFHLARKGTNGDFLQRNDELTDYMKGVGFVEQLN